MDQKPSSGPQKHKVKVVVRVRPQLEKQDKTWVQVADKKTLLTLNHRNAAETLQYEFESVYSSTCTQADVYSECVKPLLGKTLHGQNSSVFAYGPTGAGKTHTILGTGNDPGIIPRCVRDLFTIIKDEKTTKDGQNWTFKVQFSYLEIYQEKVHDLLDPRPQDLPIREDQNKNIFVTGLSEKTITNTKEFNELFAPASRNRTTAATKLNERSSRSHSILLLKITRRQTVIPYREQTGKMYIIDLAGSEDNRRTGNKGIRLKESGAINSSLLALSQVVDALQKNQSCIPYRSSKLTRLLQDSLGGGAHCCMVVNLAPEERHYFDTYTTLNFARKTKKVVNTIRTYESVDTSHQTTEVAQKKKRSLEDGKSKGSKTPEKRQKTDPAPFLSPLLRDQERFRTDLKQEMFSRLEELEGRILAQMKSSNDDSLNRDSSEGVPLPDSTTRDDDDHTDSKQSGVMDRLEGIMDRLQKYKDDGDKDGTTDDRKGKGQRKSAAKNKHKVFADGSSFDNTRPEMSSSPLFAKPSVLKRKGFTSTAAKKFIDSPLVKSSKSKTDKENSSGSMNPEVQKSHNNRILLVLNTGTVKELQELQTVGNKRAKLIQSWRDLNGHFCDFDGLRNVHGLTSKYVDNFLRSNLIQLS